jgi:hypothetical protein
VGGNGPDSATNTDQAERRKLVFDIWAKAVDTQMHFNEMSARSRQLGLTFTVSALGLAVFLLGRGDDWRLLIPLESCYFRQRPILWGVESAILAVWITYFFRHKSFSETSRKGRAIGITIALVAGPLALLELATFKGFLSPTWSVPLKQRALELHVSIILVAASVVALLLVRRLDLSLYHQMLVGSVAFGEELENQYIKPEILPKVEKGMTEAISHFSRAKNARFEVSQPQGKRYTGTDEIRARRKVRGFYAWINAVLVTSVLALLAYSNLEVPGAKVLRAKAELRRYKSDGLRLLQRANKATCGATLEDLQLQIPTASIADPWGLRYDIDCQEDATTKLITNFVIYSAGPDGIYKTNDDVI